MRVTRFHVPVVFAVLSAGFSLGCGDSSGPAGPVTGVQETLLPVEVTVSTESAAADIDPDGYTLVFDDQFGWPIGVNQARTVILQGGVHVIRLQGLSGNCVVTSPNPVSTDASPPTMVHISFAVVCAVIDDTGSGAGDWDYHAVK